LGDVSIDGRKILKWFFKRVKVKFTVEQARKALRGSIGVALLFL
jgi:hypothetical protein